MGTHAIIKQINTKMLDKSNVLQSDYISSVKEISAAMLDVLHTCNNLVGAVSKVKVTS